MASSDLCQQVIDTLKVVFPEMLIKLEEFVKYKGQKLYLDIFLPQLAVIIEVHGRQHDQFVRHFHRDERGYRLARRRDRLKEEWAALNGYSMVILREADLPVNPDTLLEHIENALND